MLLVNGSGVLTGAQNVRVGGTLYDVMFVDGTCIDVFGGCDTGSDFTFATFEDAAAAANALLGQVFVDAPVGNFDGHPELTLGCTDPSQCFAAIPTGITTAGGVVFGAVAYNSPAGKLLTNFNFLTDFDTSNDAQAVWAEFTAAQPVPEPGVGGTARERSVGSTRAASTADLTPSASWSQGAALTKQQEMSQ